MQEIIELQTVHDYQIDSIPLDKNEFIKLYDSVLDFLEHDVAYGMLYIYSLNFRVLMSEINKLTVSSDDALAGLYFLANTGYYPRSYKPNVTIIDLIEKQPDLAITDLDKALLSLIYDFHTALLNPSNKEIKRTKDELYSFIFMLHNVQNYEYKTHMTLDLSSEDVLSYEFSEDFFFNLLTNPLFSETNSKMLPLSETDVNSLNRVLEYRRKMDETIVSVRKKEKEYAQNEDNNANWELFVSWMNHRSLDEISALEMINSNADIIDKLNVFDTFLSEINDSNSRVLDSRLSLEELKQKVLERSSCACNYMEISTNSKQNSMLDEFDIHSIFTPFSFNCVLISYHAYLIDSSERHLKHLLISLEGFIRNNIDDSDTKIQVLCDHNSIVECLIRVSKLVFEFYETHKETINTLRFNNIQDEDTLSGRGYGSDIIRLLLLKETKMLEENLAAFSALDYDDSADLIDDYVFALLGENSIEEYKDNLQKHLPNSFDDEDKLLEETISNRLVVSVNAIYILIKTIERILSSDTIEETNTDKLYRIKKRLSVIEKNIVTTTYYAPDFICFEYEDMDEYRLRRGIDASKVIIKNRECGELALFDIARQNICELHNEIANSSFGINNALDFKQRLREEIEGFPNSATKDFVIELVDQESQFISETLVAYNLGVSEFTNVRNNLCEVLGPLSSILPEKTVDTLTTAELLYSKYAVPEYANVNFDYSCISALYYQAVETMYNDLFWSRYSTFLNALRINGDYFGNLYGNKSTQNLVSGYLPTESPANYMSMKSKRIHNFLMMGPFSYLLNSLTSGCQTDMRYLRNHFDKAFGYESVSHNAEEYQAFQRKIDELYKLIDEAKDRRNAASHGKFKISLATCKDDKRVVLSDIESIRNNYIGLIRLFLSLYSSEN